MPIINSTAQADLRSNSLFDVTYPRLLEDNVLVSIVPTLADRYERADTFPLMFIHQDGIEL